MLTRYKAIVIGTSAGGLDALTTLLSGLPEAFPWPVMIVQHLGKADSNYLANVLNRISPLTIKEAEDKEPLLPGYGYVAPSGYHLLLEPDESFSLSVDPKVQYSCPSIDVLFESAADVFGGQLIGILLTGANYDGARGMTLIKEKGGLTIAQNPATAYSRVMPQSAIDAKAADYVLDIGEIAPFLCQLIAPYQGGIYVAT